MQMSPPAPLSTGPHSVCTVGILGQLEEDHIWVIFTVGGAVRSTCRFGEEDEEDEEEERWKLR